MLGVSVPVGVAQAATCPGGALHVVAHPDDDLLFMSPDLLHDLQSGRCVRSVFLTSGDGGGPLAVGQTREAGIEAAYAQMAGVANSWTTSDAEVAGRSIRMVTLAAVPQVSLVFLRLPDGNSGDGGGFAAYEYQSLSRLWDGEISQVSAIDGSETYTRSSLTSTLTELISDLAPAVVRTQNFASAAYDHPDHHVAAAFVREAHAVYPQGRTLLAYEGYSSADHPVNVTGDDLAGKRAALAAYASYDTAVQYIDSWVGRQYVLQTVEGSGTAPVNRTPVANAGVDLVAPAGSQVRLTGMGSSDPDGDALSFAWSQTTGPAVTLSSADASRPTFTAPAEGSQLTFSLVVTDGSLSSAADSVTVSVQAAVPGENVARSLGAAVTASSQNVADGQTADKAVDGSPLGYPADYSR
ncbi:MAG: PIG-L family deacetylase, partial [Propionicimonas sp.]